MHMQKKRKTMTEMVGLCEERFDTETLYTKIMQKICGAHGKTFTWEIKAKMMGKKEDEAGHILIDELQLPITVDEYIKEVKNQQKIVFPEAQLLPGAEKLVRHLHKHNIPICLATGSDRSSYEIKTSQHPTLFSLFLHAVFSSDDKDVKHGKPAPDCFLVAARRFTDNPQPDKVLVFEDAPNGVEGALAARMQVVWVPDPRADRSILGNRVTSTLGSLEEFQPEMFGLPPYDNCT
ncbi:Pseudouridine-5'-phosphatase [Lamellibrachia satsuma]|nr:Pseudouridine-5'-phosphatase [Lamellibrachia satsuma]